ncbi:MAG TPA: hypothetical protein VFS00_27575 [Polyangiaceae bacterium]|nr:hypothetical protein [Polyangiaceae bacterium]
MLTDAPSLYVADVGTAAPHQAGPVRLGAGVMAAPHPAGPVRPGIGVMAAPHPAGLVRPGDGAVDRVARAGRSLGAC